MLKEFLLKGFVINQRFAVIESFAIETERRVAEVERKIDFLTQYIESILSDFNDISEDTRAQLEAISMELAELQVKNKWKPRNPIGFIQPK